MRAASRWLAFAGVRWRLRRNYRRHFSEAALIMGSRGRIDVQKSLPIGSKPSAESWFFLTLNPADECRYWKPGEISNAAWQQLPKVLAFCNIFVSDLVLLSKPEAGNLTSLDFENASHLLIIEFDKWPSRPQECLTARQVNEEKASFSIQTMLKYVLLSPYGNSTVKQAAVAFWFVYCQDVS